MFSVWPRSSTFCIVFIVTAVNQDVLEVRNPRPQSFLCECPQTFWRIWCCIHPFLEAQLVCPGILVSCMTFSSVFILQRAAETCVRHDVKQRPRVSLFWLLNRSTSSFILLVLLGKCQFQSLLPKHSKFCLCHVIQLFVVLRARFDFARIKT